MFSAPAIGDDVKPLDKQTATTILELMGNKQVTVGAIVVGASPSVRSVLAVGVRNGKEVKIQDNFEYDADLGWFNFEFQVTNAKGQPINPDLPPPPAMFGGGGSGVSHVKLRIWSVSGYKEVVVSN